LLSAISFSFENKALGLPFPVSSHLERNDDPVALQRYVERMVDVRKYQNKYKAGALFSDLRGKIIREISVLPQCYCICY
jgi:hypothetical protein